MDFEHPGLDLNQTTICTTAKGVLAEVRLRREMIHLGKGLRDSYWIFLEISRFLLFFSFVLVLILDLPIPSGSSDHLAPFHNLSALAHKTPR